jgi:hypothetical protein
MLGTTLEFCGSLVADMLLSYSAWTTESSILWGSGTEILLLCLVTFSDNSISIQPVFIKHLLDAKYWLTLLLSSL